MEKFMIAILVVALTSVMLQTVGYATSGWIRFKLKIENSITGQDMLFVSKYGLWSAEMCFQNLKCETYKYSERADVTAFDSVAENFSWTRYQAVATIALIMGILGAIFTATHARTEHCCAGVVTIVCMAFSGGLFYYVVGKFIKIGMNLRDIFNAFNPMLKDSTLSTGIPYSIVLVALGAVGAICTAVMILINICCCDSRGTLRKSAGRIYQPTHTGNLMVSTTTTTTSRF